MVRFIGRASDFPIGLTGVYGGPWQPATTVSHHYLGMWESPFGAIYDVAFDEQATRMVAGCEGGFRVWEMPRPGARRSAVETLLERDIIAYEHGMYKIAVPLFGVWVQRSNYR